jgi:EAL domain-containing protein (putative c-di-GMP-specific phosphodiesterase class I)
MEDKFYAVIMGFNKYDAQDNLPPLRYAENDAQELYNVLTSSDSGGHPKDNIILLTGKPSLEKIKSCLTNQIVNKRSNEDTVLVYYSGHGFITGKNRSPHLGVPRIRRILDNREPGLSMQFLYDEIFLKTPAKYVVFVLDCCYSGDFLKKSLGDSRYFSGEGRVAFVSSPRGVTSRESKDLEHGVFTYYILQGLKGDAIDHKGDVTISSLISYVQTMTPVSQPPVMYGEGTRIFLLKPPRDNEVNSFQTTISDKIKYHLGNTTELSRTKTLANPLQGHIEYIDKLLKSLTSLSHKELSVDRKILTAILSSLQANAVFVERFDSQLGFATKAIVADDEEQNKSEKILDWVLQEIYPILMAKKADLLPRRNGIYQQLTGIKGQTNNVLVIPTSLELPRDFIVIAGAKSEDINQYGEILGHTLISLYQSTRELTTLQLSRIEDKIWDDLKLHYGNIPYSLYKKRLFKFKERLNKLKFAFEPIVRLRKNPSIDSWEALARDPDTGRAPYDLFLSAELWGREFTTELDLFCLETAVTDYVRLWQQERSGHRMDPLSVNVYPDTLYRTIYKKKIHQLTKDDDVIPGEQLVLEISEKKPITRDDDTAVTVDPIDAFVNELHKYDDYNIQFAIDDFGIEHSSIARLTRLDLAHVKIDRDVLHHFDPSMTIKYVNSLVSERQLRTKKIVVEGFDDDSNISLFDLYNECKVLFVQGHMIRRASLTLQDLELNQKLLISKLIFTH